MTLIEQHNSIHSREDFVAFIKALSKDYHDNSPSWENTDLESYLDAIGAWVEDMDGYYSNQGLSIPRQLDWKVMGAILMAAKTYE